VDVKALDEKGKHYEVEIQLNVYDTLTSRMLFTWSSIYHSLLGQGDDYNKLKPVISIWIVKGNVFADTEDCHLSFSVYNPEHKLTLSDHLAIHILQLPKWKYDGKIHTEKERWLYLFKEGKNADPENPPKVLDTEEMRQAMKVLQRFSENQWDYLLYQSRLDAILTENTLRNQIEAAKKEKAEAEKRAEQIQKESEEKISALVMLLKEKGINLPEGYQAV